MACRDSTERRLSRWPSDGQNVYNQMRLIWYQGQQFQHRKHTRQSKILSPPPVPSCAIYPLWTCTSVLTSHFRMQNKLSFLIFGFGRQWWMFACTVHGFRLLRYYSMVITFVPPQWFPIPYVIVFASAVQLLSRKAGSHVKFVFFMSKLFCTVSFACLKRLYIWPLD